MREIHFDAIVREAIEEVGIAGLCRDGQREFAVDRILSETSAMNRERIAIAVNDYLSKGRVDE
ncbi:MAG: hypothetical protein VYD85_20750 [Pseudomonadota bacterium]|nr:hypothetical protein [Pseudomonadota bacterium]